MGQIQSNSDHNNHRIINTSNSSVSPNITRKNAQIIKSSYYQQQQTQNIEPQRKINNNSLNVSEPTFTRTYSPQIMTPKKRMNIDENGNNNIYSNDLIASSMGYGSNINTEIIEETKPMKVEETEEEIRKRRKAKKKAKKKSGKTEKKRDGTRKRKRERKRKKN